MTAVLLISHGSQSQKTEIEVKRLLEVLKKSSTSDIPIFRYAFLEIQKPSIPEGIELCIKDGARRIIILPNFLNSGKHVDEDIPRIVEEARNKHPEVKIELTHPVGQHHRLPELFLDIITKTLSHD